MAAAAVATTRGDSDGKSDGDKDCRCLVNAMVKFRVTNVDTFWGNLQKGVSLGKKC